LIEDKGELMKKLESVTELENEKQNAEEKL